MTEYRDNTLLRGLLLEAAAEDLDALLAETGEVDTTPRFRTSMAALVADPKGWAKRRQRPVWRRAARMAAAILLACVLTLGILMLVSPKVYAAISQWFVYRYDTHILYHFSSDHDDVILRDYQPTYIPAGYSTDREYTCRPNEFTNTTEFEYPGPGTYRFRHGDRRHHPRSPRQAVHLHKRNRGEYASLDQRGGQHVPQPAGVSGWRRADQGGGKRGGGPPVITPCIRPPGVVQYYCFFPLSPHHPTGGTP